MTITGHDLLAIGAFGGVTVWLLRLYFQPRADCRRCGGTGRNAFTRAFGGGRNGRTGSCGACGGSGKRFVLGAAVLHRMIGRRKKGQS
jgi:hypothetical protein